MFEFRSARTTQIALFLSLKATLIGVLTTQTHTGKAVTMMRNLKAKISA